MCPSDIDDDSHVYVVLKSNEDAGTTIHRSTGVTAAWSLLSVRSHESPLRGSARVLRTGPHDNLSSFPLLGEYGRGVSLRKYRLS